MKNIRSLFVQILNLQSQKLAGHELHELYSMKISNLSAVLQSSTYQIMCHMAQNTHQTE